MSDKPVVTDARGSEAFAASVAFFEHSMDGVLFTVPDGRILDANDAACRMLRLTRSEICRRGRAGLADPDDPRWVLAAEVRTRTGRFRGPLSLRRGDGTNFEALISSVVFADAAGEPRTVVVMRAAEPSTEERNAAVVDRAGVANRPAFVFLAEQQCRKATREHVGIGFVYARLVETETDRGVCPPSDDDITAFAALFAEDCGWGDVVGRVGDHDFAMLLSADDESECEEVARSIHRRVADYNAHADEHLRVHVGAMSTTPTASVVGLLDDAAEVMRRHEQSEHAWTASGCCIFYMRQPSNVLAEPRSAADATTDLTARELAVLQLLARRLAYAEIAEALFISVNTVKTHATHVYTKLGVTNRNDAMAAARRAGLLTRPRTIRRGGADDVTGEREVTRATGEDIFAAKDGSLTRRIAHLLHALTGAEDGDQALDMILTLGTHELHAHAGLVVGVDGDYVTPLASVGYSHDSIVAFFPAPLDLDLPITVAAREGTTVCIEDREQAQARYPELTSSPVARSSAWIATPLLSRGHCIGALGVSLFEPHAFTADERNFVKSLADLCVLTLHTRAGLEPGDAVF